MPLRNVYVIARNISGRPCLQHRLADGQTDWTACGRNVSAWSRQVVAKRLDAILCLSKACRK